MQRRDFLKLFSLALAGSAAPLRGIAASLAAAANAAERPYLLLPYMDSTVNRFGICGFDLGLGRFTSTETKFNVHSVFHDPKSGEFFGVNAFGTNYLKFRGLDFSGQEYFQVDPRFRFTGHVVGIPGSDRLFLSAVHAATFRSCIVSLDRRSGKAELATNLDITNPPAHDCKFLPNSEVLLITSGKKVHQFDTKAGKLVDATYSLAAEASSLRHFSVGPKGELCLQSNVINTSDFHSYSYARTEMGFVSDARFQSVLIADIDERLKDLVLLDLAFSRSGDQFACVHSPSRILTIWDAKPFRFRRSVEFDEIIVRVSPYFDEDFWLVVGVENIFLLDPHNFRIRALGAMAGHLQKNHTYAHRLIGMIS